MEVVNARAALLSNYEVLTLLRELENEHLTQSKAAIRVKKEEGTSKNNPAVEEISENLRTIEVEAIQYLSADFHPTTSQTPEGIQKLVRDLAESGLTKAEKLQVVNLAPKEPVELYVIVEELEDRIGDNMDTILDQVRASLSNNPGAPIAPTSSHVNGNASEFVFRTQDDTWDHPMNEAIEDNLFDDGGEGAGVEGDLDVEED